MDDFIKLYNKNSFDFYNKFKIFFTMYGENFVLKDILPLHYKNKYDSDRELLLNKTLMLDEDYNYFKYFTNQNIVFDSLERAKIDGLLLLAYKEIEKNDTVLSCLNSFNPKNSFSRKVAYNRVDTLTGRLTVKSGPKILTIPSRCRNIIKSRFDNGTVFNVDFKSLEPRIASYISKNNFCEDIYEEIQKKLSFKTDRSVIKRSVISLLYGSSIKNIENISIERTKEILKTIEEYFDFETLLYISKKIDKKGYRRNLFGRPIHNTKETNERKILNNFIQSTAVDISLNYFSELIKKTNSKKALPVFIIHDAIIFDVSPEYKKEFIEIINDNYSTDIGIFPLEVTEINRSDN
jgi:DNA polymerase I-like protein with 3'-5' exonuclease and polymerase domains